MAGAFALRLYLYDESRRRLEGQRLFLSGFCDWLRLFIGAEFVKAPEACGGVVKSKAMADGALFHRFLSLLLKCDVVGLGRISFVLYSITRCKPRACAGITLERGSRLAVFQATAWLDAAVRLDDGPVCGDKCDVERTAHAERVNVVARDKQKHPVKSRTPKQTEQSGASRACDFEIHFLVFLSKRFASMFASYCSLTTMLVAVATWVHVTSAHVQVPDDLTNVNPST